MALRAAPQDEKRGSFLSRGSRGGCATTTPRFVWLRRGDGGRHRPTRAARKQTTPGSPPWKGGEGLCWVLVCWLLSPIRAAAAPTSAILATTAGPRLASLTAGQLHVAALRETIDELGATDAAGITSLAPCPKPAGWYAARDRELLHRPIAGGAWKLLHTFADPIAQLMPAPDGSDELVILTGEPSEPVLTGGQVWRRSPGARPVRVSVIKAGYRPYRLWPAHRDGRPQLAAATWKTTRFMPFEHNCLFLFGWAKTVTPTWLGSGLSRPYVDACHADLRHDATWRLLAIETDAEGQSSLAAYHPVGFGYEGEWRSESIPGLTRICAFGDAVVVTGSETSQILPSDDGYRLVRLTADPLDLDGVLRAGDSLIGHGEGGWWRVPLAPGDGEGP